MSFTYCMARLASKAGGLLSGVAGSACPGVVAGAGCSSAAATFFDELRAQAQHSSSKPNPTRNAALAEEQRWCPAWINLGFCFLRLTRFPLSGMDKPGNSDTEHVQQQHRRGKDDHAADVRRWR